MKDNFIENRIKYIKCGNYYIPNLTVPVQQYQIGKHGRLHGKFIKEHYRAYSDARAESNAIIFNA